ncbi:MAG TPA: UDP-glucose 4-epimerase GalE [Burkholderiales bacterium]|nr:UDP-glucose 4-epimerase GalE [Burkholderiales bacterium]
MKILVAGGAGYIGSHMTKMLLAAGHETLVMDNLSTGFRDAVPARILVRADLAHRVLLDSVLSARRFDGVMHFASSMQVGESVANPARYYWNNVVNTLNLLDAMVKHRVKRLIFSSTAAIFGEPCYDPVDEEHRQAPINPYGRTKWMVEQVLADFERAYGLRHSCMRYFNASGADPAGTLGERHDPETHLIPLTLQAASGRMPAVTIFGTDYDTPDGTCIRDYVHVTDLCSAHLLALERMMDGAESRSFNLGNGSGYSVQEVIDTARQVTGRKIKVAVGERRPGDPVRLVADAARACRELGWQPKYSDLGTIVSHAWTWESNRPVSPARSPASAARNGRAAGSE